VESIPTKVFIAIPLIRILVGEVPLSIIELHEPTKIPLSRIGEGKLYLVIESVIIGNCYPKICRGPRVITVRSRNWLAGLGKSLHESPEVQIIL